MKKHALGIDLGTTFSEVSVVLNKNPELVADKNQKRNIPSLVYISQDNGKIKFLVGTFALKKQKSQPKSTVYDTKRMLGKRYDDPEIQAMKKEWPFEIEKSETGGILINIEGVEKKFHPYEISGEILKYLVEIGNQRFPEDEKTRDVIITIPANFGDGQRSETLLAAKYADLNVLTFVNEPTSAGIAFGATKTTKKKGEHVLIFDFGGGTLDVSILFISEKEITVKATAGDMNLGGRDFDSNLVNYLIDKLDLPNTFLKNKKKMNKLRETAIDIKIDLSNSSYDDQIDITPEDDEFEEGKKITLSEFEEINKDLISRIFAPIEKVLSYAKIDRNKVDKIITVGGSSHMQFVKRELKNFFKKEPYIGVDPWEAVGLGAGMLAAKVIEDGEIPSWMKVVKLTDICPFSIGTTNSDGKMDVLIKKNQPIPQVVSQVYHTILYRQEDFYVDVLEGEEELSKNNRIIGGFTIKNLPKTEKFLDFKITFSLDKNGILSARANLIGGNLIGSTSIDIKKVDPRSNDEELNENTPQKIFYTNLQRFIEFNLDSFQQLYSNVTITRALNDINFRMKHLDPNDVEFVEITDYASGFLMQYDKYFKVHEPPYFLEILKV